MPYLVTKPYQIISNGYDEVDFTGSETHQYQPRLRMVYFGSFYDHQQPDILWRAISHLTTEGIIDQNTMEVQIIGNNTPRFVLRSYSRSPYLTRIVGFSGFQSHRLSCREMMKADILLLYIAGGRQSDFVLTGKLFSYIRSGRPILAIVPENGLAAEIIRTSKTGFIADSLDIDAICQQLSRIYHLWQNRSLDINPDWQYIAQFSNRNHADKLASLIYSCIRES
ncbi:MAG: hypothetical protein FJ042_04670 [Candidatus Cloacimonetes bacterium]|nr:hypothetical protein [Candidatus Cloacimonadota bacterium]